VDERVQLRKPDGTEISVDIELLSASDRRWNADELRRLHEEEKGDDSADKTAGQEVIDPLAAQEVSMKLLRLDQPKGKTRSKAAAPTAYFLSLTAPQQFYMQLGTQAGANEAEFRRTVKKEPTYEAPAPFRGVAKLGSGRYCFALDAVGTRAGGYNRLYFDLNGNGDLTDDKPISAATVASPSAGLSQSQFPRVDMAIDVDGQSAEYSFLLSAICRQSPSPAYVNVSLYAAAVREGYLTQGKNRTRLLLLDRNSNGRFNDLVSIQAGGAPTEGDLLLINPNVKSRYSGDASMSGDRNLVGKTTCIGKEFYRMEIPPGGERLKLTPAKLTLGSVANSSPAYRAVLLSEDYGVVIVSGVKDQKVPLPEGTWRIASYTIDASGARSGARTAVAATFRGQSPAATVSKAETAQLMFGAPFRAVVTAARTSGNKVYLSLAIVGVGGEQCTSLFVNGARPPPPRFAIKDKAGKIVQQGSFEYG
jgi:hypothetical protein